MLFFVDFSRIYVNLRHCFMQFSPFSHIIFAHLYIFIHICIVSPDSLGLVLIVCSCRDNKLSSSYLIRYFSFIHHLQWWKKPANGCVSNLPFQIQQVDSWMMKECNISWIRTWRIDRDKIADIFQPTFSNAFSWMEMYECRLRFHWSLFLRVQLTISQHWFT